MGSVILIAVFRASGYLVQYPVLCRSTGAAWSVSSARPGVAAARAHRQRAQDAGGWDGGAVADTRGRRLVLLNGGLEPPRRQGQSSAVMINAEATADAIGTTMPARLADASDQPRACMT